MFGMGLKGGCEMRALGGDRAEGAVGVQDPRWQELGGMDWNRRELEGGGQPGSLSAGLGMALLWGWTGVMPSRAGTPSFLPHPTPPSGSRVHSSEG